MFLNFGLTHIYDYGQRTTQVANDPEKADEIQRHDRSYILIARDCSREISVRSFKGCCTRRVRLWIKVLFKISLMHF